MRSLQDIDLAQYRTQAKELVRQVRAGLPEALDRLHRAHPEREAVTTSGSPQLADAQLVVARENGFASWRKFREYLLFRNAVHALDSGDLPKLEALLDRHPFLLRYRCRVGEPYEQGYFAGATLLNHIAGNPIRGPLPPNILDVARLLLSRGARDEPPHPRYTLGLLLTSKPASDAGVAWPLMDLLTAAQGIDLDLKHNPESLSIPLREEAFGTAEEMVRRGARMDVRHAAALGRLDLVRRFLEDPASVEADASLIPLPKEPEEAQALKEKAFTWACMSGRTEVARYFLENGVDPGAFANVAQPGLQIAAHMGRLETVRMLLARNAPLEAKNQFGATVLGQAVWSALHEPRESHLAIIEALVAAGADVKASGYPTGDERIDERLRPEGAT